VPNNRGWAWLLFTFYNALRNWFKSVEVMRHRRALHEPNFTDTG